MAFALGLTEQINTIMGAVVGEGYEAKDEEPDVDVGALPSIPKMLRRIVLHKAPPGIEPPTTPGNPQGDRVTMSDYYMLDTDIYTIISKFMQPIWKDEFPAYTGHNLYVGIPNRWWQNPELEEHRAEIRYLSSPPRPPSRTHTQPHSRLPLHIRKRKTNPYRQIVFS